MPIEIVVAKAYNHPLIVFRGPIPECIPRIGVLLGIGKVEIGGVARNEQYVARHLQRMLRKIGTVLCKFQVQVANKLYFHGSKICAIRADLN